MAAGARRGPGFRGCFGCWGLSVKEDGRGNENSGAKGDGNSRNHYDSLYFGGPRETFVPNVRV